MIVLDGVGIGAAPDADRYGDAGSDTLGNIAKAVGGFHLPNFERLGLGCCRPLRGLGCDRPTAAHGVAIPRSPGKDSTTGHWEICGLQLPRPFPTYAEGFPSEVIEAFQAATGRGVLGNRPASGTAIIDELGAAHLEHGHWIVYTSADSVFQVAAHEDRVPLDELYKACELARSGVLQGRHAVSRVIARPFRGEPGGFQRTANRRDFSLPPSGETLLDVLARHGIERVGVGKVDDLFAHRAITSIHTPTNTEALRCIHEALRRMTHGLVFANVIEFDQSWGHRNDVAGFYQGLREFDDALPELAAQLEGDDLMILTADHGNDPTTPSTDHSREAVPILVVGPTVQPTSIGERTTFADIGATVADYFGIVLETGTSFLPQVCGGR
ncbi:MAG: phosphopentomutase [Gemmatimonadota bacterium]|nr:phosphopentomutase [Gemmatimonadota bacterium]